jgi:hypothetical protein
MVGWVWGDSPTLVSGRVWWGGAGNRLGCELTSTEQGLGTALAIGSGMNRHLALQALDLWCALIEHAETIPYSERLERLIVRAAARKTRRLVAIGL